jgi:macrodomain Ter protein organizer (MatP/YcbG family)
MVRSRYTITEPDMAAALAYIGSKLRDPWWPSEDTTAQVKAERGFRMAKRDPVTLNRWCEKHLSADQWIQLKNAIRAARKRTADLSRDPLKSVTLSHKAWQIISDLAKRDGVTLSELIEDRLGKEWGKL